MLRELGITLSKPPILWCDNISATYLSANPVFHSHTKHMDIDYHFVRDIVATKTLKVAFCSSNDQIANTFTKPLISEKFSIFRSSLNVSEIPMDSQGHIKLDHFVGHTPAYSLFQCI
ncbi:hypothetical protein F2P56_022289 [Juglans regia]|uniref:Secreted RxLR effector protein 161-like n=1 Tax=Juglans regia TaxID=51240 RepID=A0A833UK55_JUGRE|nr:hypothetical protein F2P56_022289 [Juglans regia]